MNGQEALDFGLFTRFPSPKQLITLCPPVFWVTLLAMPLGGCPKPERIS